MAFKLIFDSVDSREPRERENRYYLLCLELYNAP